MTPPRPPLRGEIWWAHFAIDPPGKNRPAVVVSQNGRNQHPFANSVLAIPLSTPMPKLGPWHLLLQADETGLPEDTVAWAEKISDVGKDQLIEPVPGHRPLSNTQICKLAALVSVAMGCVE